MVGQHLNQLFGRQLPGIDAASILGTAHNDRARLLIAINNERPREWAGHNPIIAVWFC